MKNLLDKISKGAGKVLKNTKDFAKRNYNTLALVGTMALAGTTLFSPAKAYSQTPSTNYNNNTKTEQVDTLWGKNNSTPDSVVYNIFSRPDIVKTYGKVGDNPNLDWENLTPSEKASYFTKAMSEFIKLYPNYIKIIQGNDTTLNVDNEDCYFYTSLADYVIGGENNIESDAGYALNKYSDIKKITINNNGFGNLPILYITDVSNANESHSVSGIIIDNSITQNITLENNFQIRDSKTNVSALPNTPPMATTGTVTINREGYFDGKFNKSTNLTLMAFQFNSNGSSYLAFINPQLQTINGKTISSTASIPADINYSSDWTSKLEKAVTNTTNQNLNSTIHTDDGTTKVDISYFIVNKLSFSDTTALHNATEGTIPIEVTDTVQYMQKGTRKNTLHPNGQDYYTKLHQDIVKQTVNVTKVATGLFNHKQVKSPYENYPNPAKKGETFYIRFPQSSNGSKFLIQFYTISGKLVGQEEVTPSGQDIPINALRYNFPRGMVLEKITNEKTGKSATLTGIVE